MAKINCSDFIREVAECSGCTMKSVRAVMDGIQKALVSHIEAGDSVKILPFMTIDVVDRAQRVGRNPRTGEKMVIPECKTLKAKFSASIKEVFE